MNVVSELPLVNPQSNSLPSHAQLTTYPWLTTALASCQAVSLRVISGRVKKSKVTNLISILILRPSLDYYYFLTILRSRGKYEAVHPQSSWVTCLGRLCKRNEGNLQRKRGRKKASYLLKCSFTPDKTFRFVLSMHKSIRKTLLAYTARSFGGVQLHIIYRSRYVHYILFFRLAS